MPSVIIIGGGIAGLTAAYELSKQKWSVTLLEAKPRLGGRVHTIVDNSFSQPVELGAEFVHGDLPLTLSLLRQAGIPYHKITDSMVRNDKGQWKTQDDFTDDWDKLMKQMENLQQDISLSDFLDQHFASDKYQSLRKSVIDFAGGFDLADAKTAGVKSLYKEWSNEMDNQYRIDGGYKLLVDYLQKQCKKNGCIIELDCWVQKIDWRPNNVAVMDKRGRSFDADKVVIAVPVSVLHGARDDNDYVEFNPSILTHQEAAKNIGFGSVIKVLIEFQDNFWNDRIKDAGFFLTDERIPTWWTQLPRTSNLLTGWVGGEKEKSLLANTDEEILLIALQSLSNVFDIPINDLQNRLKASKIANWNTEAHINGGYSFNTTASDAAKKTLSTPIDNTIFFTGEALFDGTPGGTVEAAITSAKDTVGRVLQMHA